MNITPKLSLPYILPGQAQKHVTHNEALSILDDTIHLSSVSVDRVDPPEAPVEGECHIIGKGALDAWLEKDGYITIWRDSIWNFYLPQKGWTCWNQAENNLLIWDGELWQALTASSAEQNVFGINTTGDLTNRLAVKSDAVLFSHDDVTPRNGDMRIAINKSADDKTASLVFQSQFQGRAEIGIVGEDNFSIKVLNDADDWQEPLHINSQTGVVSMPQTFSSADGRDGEIRFNDSGRVEGNSNLTYKKDKSRIGVNTSAPEHSFQFVKTAADRLSAAFAMTGLARSGPDPQDSHGVGLYLNYNQPNNRQFALCDTATGNGVRFFGTGLDAITAFGQRADLTIGTYTNGAHIGLTAANSQFSVSNQYGEQAKTVCEIAGSTDQAGDLLKVTQTHGQQSGDALTITAQKMSIFGGSVRLAAAAVLDLPSASHAAAGAMLYCLDVSGGPQPIFSDGINWRKFSDREIIS